MNPRHLLFVLMLTLTSACSDWPDGFGSKACSEAGCLNFVRVELVLPPGYTEDDVEVVVERDGQSVTCDFGNEGDPCHKGFQPDFDPVSSGTMAEGHLVVLLDEAPEQLTITVTSAEGAKSLLVSPEYELNQPNGPDCEPTCSSASTSLQVAW